MELWDFVKSVPEEHKKKIQGGKLKGFTDIKPQWRFQILTQYFGACGTGWRYEIVNKEMVEGSNRTIAVFVDILLYYRVGKTTWSHGIPGTGGSMFVQLEKGKLVTSDEAYKMALTDAVSVAAKALGVGSDVYMGDKTKYSAPFENSQALQAPNEPIPPSPAKATAKQFDEISILASKIQDVFIQDSTLKWIDTHGTENTSEERASALIKKLKEQIKIESSHE